MLDWQILMHIEQPFLGSESWVLSFGLRRLNFQIDQVESIQFTCSVGISVSLGWWGLRDLKMSVGQWSSCIYW